MANPPNSGTHCITKIKTLETRSKIPVHSSMIFHIQLWCFSCYTFSGSQLLLFHTLHTFTDLCVRNGLIFEAASVTTSLVPTDAADRAFWSVRYFFFIVHFHHNIFAPKNFLTSRRWLCLLPHCLKKKVEISYSKTLYPAYCKTCSEGTLIFLSLYFARNETLETTHILTSYNFLCLLVY